MKPTKSILDRTFRYVPAIDTNIRVRFMRIRVQQEVEKAMQEEPTLVEFEPSNVLPLRKVQP